MLVEIYSKSDEFGKPNVGIIVRGESDDSPEQVAEMFKKIREILEIKEDK